MTRLIANVQLLFGLLIVTAAPSFGQSAQQRPQPAPPPPTLIPVQGAVEAVDAEERTVQLRLLGERWGVGSETITVPLKAQISRRTEVAAAEIAVGDVLQVQSSLPQIPELLAAVPNAAFPPRFVSAVGEVIALEPLTLRTGAGITIAIQDVAGMEFHCWRNVELANLSSGDLLDAVAETGESGLIASLIRVWSAPTPVAQSAPAPAGREGFPEVEVMGPEDAKVKIVGLVPIVNPCHAATIAALREVYKEHPDDIRLTLVDLMSPDSDEWKDRLGVTCATVAINGRYTFDLEGRTVTFQKAEGLTYTPADLKPVVESELAKAASPPQP